MDKQQFWDIIQRSLKAEDVEAQVEFLSNELGKLSKEEIVEFDYIFREMHEECYTWDLWAAAYTIQGGCSDDGFIDFRAWLVFRGKEVFEKAVQNSDSLAELGKETLEESEEAEDFYYVTADAYEEITGIEGLDIQDDPNFKEIELKEEPAGNDWNEDNLDELKNRNPEIFKLFWK
jgi:hypothetical protein